MTGELYINGKDAFTEWGVNMGEGFLDTLLEPCSLKSYVQNESRLEHGKHIIIDEPRFASREITLQFVLRQDTQSAFTTAKQAFLALLYAGAITISVPQASAEVFRLVFTKSTSYALNTDRTLCKISAKFVEPNPTDR